CSLPPPEQCAGVNRAHAGGDQLPSMSRGQDDVAVVDLTLPCLPAQLSDRFRHAGEIAEVIAGEQAAAGVDRGAAARTYCARLDKRTALAFLAEAVVLELKQHLGGEAVVELATIDIVERERGLAKRLVPRPPHPPVRNI